jgi:hypothetical protein
MIRPAAKHVQVTAQEFSQLMGTLWAVNNLKKSRKSALMSGMLSRQAPPQEFQKGQSLVRRLSFPIGHVAVVVRILQIDQFDVFSIQPKLVGIHHDITS